MLIFLSATFDFQYIFGREKWNTRQRNSIITVRIPLFSLMAGRENIAIFGLADVKVWGLVWVVTWIQGQ